MDMCVSLSKEIIKHPFATCPGHHSCRLFSDIHPMMVILAAKLILHTNQSSALVRTFICTVWFQSMAFLHVWKSCDFSVLLNLGLVNGQLFNLCRAFRICCGQQLTTVMVERPPFFISSKSQIPLFDPTPNFSERLSWSGIFSLFTSTSWVLKGYLMDKRERAPPGSRWRGCALHPPCGRGNTLFKGISRIYRAVDA